MHLKIGTSYSFAGQMSSVGHVNGFENPLNTRGCRQCTPEHFRTRVALRTPVMSLSKVPGVDCNSNGIVLHINTPRLVTNVDLSIELGCILT